MRHKREGILTSFQKNHNKNACPSNAGNPQSHCTRKRCYPLTCYSNFNAQKRIQNERDSFALLNLNWKCTLAHHSPALPKVSMEKVCQVEVRLCFFSTEWQRLRSDRLLAKPLRSTSYGTPYMQQRNNSTTHPPQETVSPQT